MIPSLHNSYRHLHRLTTKEAAEPSETGVLYTAPEIARMPAEGRRTAETVNVVVAVSERTAPETAAFVRVM